jgi:hypothetical protein
MKTFLLFLTGAMALLPGLAPADEFSWSYAANGQTCAVGGCADGIVDVNVTASGTLDTSGPGAGEIIDGSGTRTITATDGSTLILQGSGTDTFTQNVYIAPLLQSCTYGGAVCVFETANGSDALYDNVLLGDLELDGNGIILTDGISGAGDGGFGDFVAYVSGPGGPSSEFTDLPNNNYYGGSFDNMVQDFTAVDITNTQQPGNAPEPATFALAGLALAGLGLCGRIRRAAR